MPRAGLSSLTVAKPGQIIQCNMRTAASLVCLLLSLLAAWGANRLTNEWSSPLGSYSDSAPAIGPDGTIYLGTRAGRLWAINPDGTRKWVFAAQNEIKSAPAVGPDGTVYFGSRDRRFYALRADGRKQWEFKTGGWVDSSPALARDGAVYFGSWDRSFYALGADGAKQWQFTTAGPVVSSPAIGTDGTIYFGSHDKKLYALAADGRKKWEFATGGPIISSPALNQDQCIYFTSVDGCLYALDPNGKLIWRLRTGSINESSPVIGLDGTVYVGAFGHLWAISADGRKKWGGAGDVEYPCEASPVAFADDTVCCVPRSGLIWFHNRDGTVRGTHYLSSFGCGSLAVGPAGTIYAADGEIAFGGFSALRADAPLARSPWPKFRGNARNTGNLQDAALQPSHEQRPSNEKSTIQ